MKVEGLRCRIESLESTAATGSPGQNAGLRFRVEDRYEGENCSRGKVETVQRSARHVFKWGGAFQGLEFGIWG